MQNPAFSGPGATTAPYNQKTHHASLWIRYARAGTVARRDGADGVAHPLTGVSWGNATITASVNCGRSAAGLHACSSAIAPYRALRRAGDHGGDNGKQSIDAITVTVGGKTPTYVNGENGTENAIQLAIDAAAPGDLIIVGPGTYHENVLMWKPVRLQGVGSGAVTINADAHPVGKMDPWRRQVVCLFGLSLNGVPRGGADGDTNVGPFDPTGTYSCPANMYLRDDRIPFEAIVGWDATGNGNLAQVLQEPTLMGAYEGAGISVLGRGIRIPANSTDFWGLQGGAVAGAFPDGSVYLTNSTANCTRQYVDGCAISAAATTAPATSCATPRASTASRSSTARRAVAVSSSTAGTTTSKWPTTACMPTMARSRAASTWATARFRLRYLNDGTICGNGVPQPASAVPADRQWRRLPNRGDSVRVQHQGAHPPQRRVQQRRPRRRAVLGHAFGRGRYHDQLPVADNYRIDHNWISGNLATGDGAGIEHRA